jgi:hypothetical protein
MATKEQITKSQVDLIPALPTKEVETALAELRTATANLGSLRERADPLAVKDKDSYTAAGQLRAEVRSASKIGALKLKPYLEVAKRVVEYLRTEISKHETEAAKIEGSLDTKINDHLTREKAAAAAEQTRINEERNRQARIKSEEDRKERERIAKETKERRVAEIKADLKSGKLGKRDAARLLKEAGALEESAIEQAAADAEVAREAPKPVEVKPDLPVIAGSRKRTIWDFVVLDENRLPRKYMTPNLVKIGADVRFNKSKEKSEAEIPGIEVSSRDEN